MLTVMLGSVPMPVWSQTEDSTASINLGQARNTARQAIENLNGGLQEYRAEPAMHGPACLAPFTDNGDGSLTFTFFGGPPASPFTTESVVTVRQGEVVEVLYNGPIRPNTQADRSASGALGNDSIREDCVSRITLISAKNVARQAAEVENGGLSQYRSEAAMHGPSVDAPFIENEDGSLTFTFQGRHPENLNYTIESVVTVTLEGEVNIEYNGPIR